MKKGKKKFNLENFIKKSKNDKKKYILSESKKIKTVPSNIIEDLKQPYKYKEVINRFIVEYIKKKQEQDQSDNNDKILNQINNLPHYIYKIITKDLLRTSIEIHGFMKNKLGVSPEVLYRDFQSLKNSQQYNLTGKVDYDKWIENESSKLL